MKKVAIVALMFVAVAFAGGRGYGGFVLTYTMPDLSALSAEFHAHGLPEIDDQMFTFGGGGWGGAGVMVGGWGFGGSRQFDGDSVSIDLSYSGGFFEPGYFINIWRGFGIWPAVGIGGTNVSMYLRPVLGDVNFGDILDNPARSSKINYGTFTVAPNISILIPIEFVALQIKGGYMWSPFQGEWSIEDGGNLRQGPQINPSGIYAQANILFGGGDDDGIIGRKKSNDAKNDDDEEQED
ncbi:hypothetical protein GX441_05840 [bacterium]|nr:hypothetical protein [bacterium]